MDKKQIINLCLKKEYTKRGNMLCKLQEHIIKLNKEHLLSNQDEIKNLKIINEASKLLNDLFYDKINIDMNNTKKIVNENNEMMDMIHINNLILYEKELKKLNIDDFNKIDKMIKNIINEIGCNNISNIINYLLKNSNYELLFQYVSNVDLLKFCNETFIPLFVTNGIYNNDEKIFIEIEKPIDISEKYEILLGNFYKLTLIINVYGNNLNIDIYGYFEYDNLNLKLRLSELSNNFIHNKKKELSEHVIKLKNKMSTIPIIFRENYIKNMTIGDILCNNKNTFAYNLIEDYEIYMKYISINNFKNLFNKFVDTTLLNKYKIIKLLLMNSNNKDAGLLFSLTKESKSGSVIISEIIYKNLNFSLQLKLHKTNISIKSEIEKINNIDSDDIDLKKQVILNKNMPNKVKKIALQKINEMKKGNSEHEKNALYVETLIGYPWIGENDGDIFSMHPNDMSKWKEIMIQTSDKLYKTVYGHKECKESIIELLGKWFSNPKSLGKAIGLWGPPGVGKTLIAKKLGDALGIPYTQINLGGIDDGTVLAGHSITYSGAVPGLIVKKMVEAGKSRCIMFFDELDKASYHNGRNEIYDILIHVIDSTSNNEFNDKFFQDVNFPINKVLFIFSFNDKDKIDPILLDRMEIIKVDAYMVDDKVNIVKKYLIDELKNDIGLNDIDIHISDDNIIYLVESFTFESGVRSIKRKIEKILLKLNKERIFMTGQFEKTREIKSIEITKDIIDNYLVKPNILYKKIHSMPEIGVVNGLYATTMGDGGIIPILIYMNNMGDNKFNLKLTGKQGKVMRESVLFSFTIAINCVKSKYASIFFKKYHGGLHIHTPDGATSKDGPSAGSAFTLAFLSKILDKKIKNDIGITGEIERDGCITAIGGLEYKLPGAKKAGIKLVFVPMENEKDIEKLKQINKTLFDDNFRYMLVGHIKEVLNYALIEDVDNDNDNINNICFEKTFDGNKYLTNKIYNDIFKKHIIDSDSDSSCTESNLNNSSNDSSNDSSIQSSNESPNSSNDSSNDSLIESPIAS
jgi:endopeptidase La